MTVRGAPGGPGKTPRIGLPYESARAKLDRAREHTNAFEAMLQRFVRGEGWNIYLDSDPQMIGEYAEFFIWAHLTDFNLVFRWNAVVGDAIHCLRSALDYLAWEATQRTQLTRRRGVPEPSPPFPNTSKWRNIYFPITQGVNAWPDEVNKKLWGVHPRLITLFKRAQPFYRGKLPLGGTDLYMLNQLDLIDKHRCVDLVSSEVYFQPLHIPPKATFLPRDTWKVEPNAPIGKLRFRPEDIPQPDHMYVQLHPTFDIA